MFTQDKETTAPTSAPQETNGVVSPEASTDTYADLLGTVVNAEGKQKYNDIPNALKGLQHSQIHIKELEDELNAVRAKLDKSTALDEALQKLTSPQEPQEQPTQALDETAIAAIVAQHLQAKEKQDTVTANQSKVTSALTSKFGDKAGEQFVNKAKELGMTKESLEQLSASSPAAVLALFGTSAAPSVKPNTSSFNTSAFQAPASVTPTIMDGGEERINLPMGSESILMGATNQDLMTEFHRHKKAVYDKYGLSL